MEKLKCGQKLLEDVLA